MEKERVGEWVSHFRFTVGGEIGLILYIAGWQTCTITVNISNTRRLKWNKCLSRNRYRENGFHYCVMLWNSGLREVVAVYDCECMCVWERFSQREQLYLIIFTDVEEVWQKDWLYYEGFGFLMIYRNSSLTSLKPCSKYILKKCI